MAAPRLQVLETVSVAGIGANDDRAGAAGAWAWVFDGATDVAAERLLPGPSDAAWFADALNAAMRRLADQPEQAGADLIDLPPFLTDHVGSAFQAQACRPPRDRSEHPSAAGVVVRYGSGALHYLSVGDCSLLVHTPDGAMREIGIDPDLSARDARSVEIMRRYRASSGDATWQAARAHLWPRIRQGRRAINQPGGYGAFSITEPPAEFVRAGTLASPPGTRVLMASDGFMRLVDTLGRYTPASLVAATEERSLQALVDELRSAEAGDPECVTFPRTKPSDDASALLAEVR